mmetsp:Transcript_48398/g.109956  ORF Transcript_48398/g.109956 Transcript_48398/m.109956 type:complete len:224 (+) Transcript_48398:361-1032(+)
MRKASLPSFWRSSASLRISCSRRFRSRASSRRRRSASRSRILARRTLARYSADLTALRRATSTSLATASASTRSASRARNLALAWHSSKARFWERPSRSSWASSPRRRRATPSKVTSNSRSTSPESMPNLWHSLRPARVRSRVSSSLASAASRPGNHGGSSSLTMRRPRAQSPRAWRYCPARSRSSARITRLGTWARRWARVLAMSGSARPGRSSCMLAKDRA